MKILDNENYYNFHWGNYGSGDLPSQKLKLAEVFFKPVMKYIDQKDTKILDAGCGDGVHLTYLDNLQYQNFQYTGIDIAESAILYLKSKYPEHNRFFQVMNIERLKFRSNSFDLVYAFGVLGYCEKPEKGFQELVRVCKPNGFVGIYSPQISGVSKILLQSLRKFVQIVGFERSARIAKLLIPLYSLISSSSKISIRNSNRKQLEEVIMTNISPPHLSILSHKQVKEWFEKNHLSICHDNRETASIIWGIKISDELD